MVKELIGSMFCLQETFTLTVQISKAVEGVPAVGSLLWSLLLLGFRPHPLTFHNILESSWL